MINIPEQLRNEKPPEYETCVIAPPCYDDAIQLSPILFLPAPSSSSAAEKDGIVANSETRVNETALTVVTVCATPTTHPLDARNCISQVPVWR